MAIDSTGANAKLHVEEAVAYLADLVAFDTTSRHANDGLINYVATLLERAGMTCHKISGPHGKQNLHAVIGPNAPGGVVLSGHTDVVPIDGQAWSSEPFVLTRRGDRLYGRGTADMKGFIASLLVMARALKHSRLKAPVHIALSYDEEVGCLGVPSLIADIRARCCSSPVVIIGEPTGMSVVSAHKGVALFKTTVTGREAHSSQTDRGVNAIVYAARLIQWLVERGAVLKANGAPPEFDPPYSTLHIGTISGGTAQNIIPRECVFTWELRLIPGEAWTPFFEAFEDFSRELDCEMRAISLECAIRTSVLADVPALAGSLGNPADTLLRRISGQKDRRAVAYGTEAGLFENAGLAAAICGPGDIAQAHQPDEFIEIAQLETCLAWLHRLTEALSS